MTQEICGEVNERRGVFLAETGERGVASFGRTWVSGNQQIALTTLRVTMDDGREAYGRYKNPKAVILKVRANSKPRRIAVRAR